MRPPTETALLLLADYLPLSVLTITAVVAGPAPGGVRCAQAIEQMLNARWWPRLFFREENPKPLSYLRTDRGVVGWIEIGCISHAPPFHINTIKSPIPT